MPFGLTPEVLAAAAAEPNPESLAASVRLRERFGADEAAAAVTQVMLRRRARAKFAAAAETMFFTRDGLEQASRPEVAEHHARRFLAAGVRRVLDLTCGIGSDALAFAAAGFEVVAVDRDPAVAEVARANLAGRARVVVGSAEEVLAELAGADPDTAVFCDPARRTAAGRSWRVADLSPPWSFITALLTRQAATGVKLGPGFPRSLVPDAVEAEWVSQARDTVELSLWSGSGAAASRRSAVVLPQEARLVASPVPLQVADPGRYLYEPVGAVTRAGALPALAAELEAAALQPEISYLTADRLVPTPFAEVFEVLAVFPYADKSLRAWARTHGIGTLEIKTRGLDLDPAQLRRSLRLHGPEAATVVITKAARGRIVLLVRRV